MQNASLREKMQVRKGNPGQSDHRTCEADYKGVLEGKIAHKLPQNISRVSLRCSGTPDRILRCVSAYLQSGFIERCYACCRRENKGAAVCRADRHNGVPVTLL